MNSYPSTSKSANVIYIEEDFLNEDTRTGGNVEDSKKMDFMEDVKDENMATSETCSLDFHRYFQKGFVSEDSRSNIDFRKSIEEDLNQLVENAREKITRKEDDKIIECVPEVDIEKMKEEEDSMQAYLDIDDRIPKNEVNSIYTSLNNMAKEMDMEVEIESEEMKEVKNNLLKSVENAFGKNIEENMMVSPEKVEQENLIAAGKEIEQENIASPEKVEKKNKENENAEENQRIREPIVWDIIDDKLNKKLKKHSKVEGVVAFSFDSNPFKTVRNFSIATFHHSVIREPCDNEDWLDKLNYFIKKMKITHLYVQGYRQRNYLKNKLNAVVLRLNKRDSMLTCPVCFRKSCSVFKIQTFFYNSYGYSIPIGCNDRY